MLFISSVHSAEASTGPAMLCILLWIPHNLNNSLRTVNIDFSIFLDFMEFPNISINNLKLFDVNVILTLTIRFS